MIYLKLRQAGEIINQKRREALRPRKATYQASTAQEYPSRDRQPLVRPGGPNQISFMDFVFDHIVSGRTLKNLVIVDDATHEGVAIVCEHTIGGDHLTRILDGICSQRGQPSMIRADYGPEFTGKSMLIWAYRHGITPRLTDKDNDQH